MQEELANLKSKSLIKGKQITGIPFGSGISDRTGELACLIKENEDLIELKLKELYIERNKMERYISTVSDADIRLIIRLRCINGMGWHEVGKEIGYDRTTVSKKFRKFLKDSHNSHVKDV